MAVSNTINSRLQLEFENGIDENTGNIILKSKTYNNVRTEATTEELFAVTVALVPLQQLPLHAVKRNDTAMLTQE